MVTGLELRWLSMTDIDQATLQRARQWCRQMGDRELLREYTQGAAQVRPEARIALEEELRRRELRLRPWADQSHIVLTTASGIDGFRVSKTLEVITAECVFGMNLFRDFFAGIRDVFGGRSEATQKVLRDARRTCLAELRREADELKADAVITVSLAYSEFSGQGKSMLFLVASGTAVQLERAGSHSPGLAPPSLSRETNATS